MAKNANDYLDKFLGWLSENWKFLLVAYVAWLFARKNKVGEGSEQLFIREVNEQLATISDVKAKEIASALFRAMDEFMTTDDATIESCYQLIGGNTENLKKVYNAFGRKKYGVVGSSWWDFYASNLSLYGWIKAEVDDVWVKWNALFARAGIFD